MSPSDLQLTLLQWGANNVYLLVLSKAKSKHSRKPYCHNGIVDHLGHGQLRIVREIFQLT